ADIGVLIKSGTLTYTDNEPTYYSASDSGQRGFCSNCGSRLVWRSQDPAEDWATNVTVCSLDHPEHARPYIHMFVDEQVPWYEVQDELPRTTSEEADSIEQQWKEVIGWRGS
ncbi:MAG: GFA family protein, partial [Gammaproteobacteria bacterium]